MAQGVTNPVVLRPTETMHFQTWHDKAANAVSDPLAPLTDGSLKFPNLNVTPGGEDLEDFQTNLIMPEPCPFLRGFPAVSIIRPTSIKQSGAVATLKAFMDDRLFIGQSKEFFKTAMDLASAADKATRKCSSG